MCLRLIVIPIIIPLALSMSGCAVTGPADDGFENSQESIDIGKLDTIELIQKILPHKAKTISSDSEFQ